MKKRTIAQRCAVILASAAMLLTAGTSVTAHAEEDPAAFFETSTVWAEGEDDAGGHRIPGIIVTNSDTVIAVAEARSQLGDGDPNDIVIKRSTDAGRTWSSSLVVVASEGQAWHTPTLLYDRDTSRVFLFYTTGPQPLYKFSDDDGLTWSDPVELTHLFENDEESYAVYVPGPGHGIQMSSGRLVMQIWHRKDASVPLAERDYGMSAIYSDDHGETWVRGGMAPVDPAYPINESRLLEREDGSLLVVGRNGAGKTRASRLSTVSRDGGETFAPLHLWTGVPAKVGIDSALERYTGGPDSNDPSRVLFAWANAESRADLTIGISYDDGVTFPERRLIQGGPAGYSDIAVMSDGTILVLYEVVPEVKVARFNLEWLTKGSDSLATGPELSFTKHEAEALPFSASPDSEAAVLRDGNTSAGEYVELETTKSGEHLEISFEIPHEGYYDLGYRMLKSPGRAQVLVYVDGIPAGSPNNAATSASSYPFHRFPTRHFSSGTHTLRFVVVSDHSETNPAKVGIDYIGWFAKPAAKESLTITKAVTGEADDRALYQFIASCSDRAGKDLPLPEEDQAFSLAAGASHTIERLEKGATCVITETDDGGAERTLVTIGDDTAESAEATVKHLAGDVEVTFTNAFPTGTDPDPTDPPDPDPTDPTDPDPTDPTDPSPTPTVAPGDPTETPTPKPSAPGKRPGLPSTGVDDGAGVVEAALS